MTTKPTPIEDARKRRKKKAKTIIPPGGIDTKTIRPEVEQRLLALLAESEEARTTVATLGLRAADFSLLAHRIIAEGIFELWGRNVPVEALVLAEWATKAGHITKGHVTYIELAEATGGSWQGLNILANPATTARELARDVMRAGAFRRLMGAFGEMAADQDPQKMDGRIAKIGDLISDYRSPPGIPSTIVRDLQYTPGKP